MAENLTPNITPKLTPTVKDEPKARTMSFPDAIKEVMRGKRVTRISWGNKDYGTLKDGWLTIFTKDTFHRWLVSDGDMEGQDWTVAGEEVK